MSMKMGQGKPRVYWRKNQVYLRFPTTVPVTASTSEIITVANQTVQEGVKQLNTVIEGKQLQLVLPGQQRISQQDETLLNGVYLFPVTPQTKGPPPIPTSADIVCIVDILPLPKTGTMSEMPTMNPAAMPDRTLDVIDLVNQAYQNSNQPVIAIPNMLWSASNGTDGDPTHGCPICPPMPVQEAAGQWHITVPAVPDGLKNATGERVTVFVLDTLPGQQQISDAVKNADNNNLLLQSLFRNASFDRELLSDEEAAHPQQLVMTGKDITGELVGFPMPDHGMFIAGIVHDLAPAAKIECIRVLNNYGVGELSTLLAAFKNIQYRMLRINPLTKKEGDLFQQPVVLNLSLLVMPPDNDIPPHFTREIGQHTRAELHRLLGYLINSGAIIVASAGNDSDPRDTMMNPHGVRYWPRYPAYFAYDKDYPLPDIIPVGAVNGQGLPASYSNYPGPGGIATYGGALPTLVPAGNTPDIKVAMPPDALCGVYTAPLYPALLKEMQSQFKSPQGYPEYAAANPYAWAYWSGTSFATPLISALAACVLENEQFRLSGYGVREAIIAGAPQIPWTNLEKREDLKNETTGSTPMIQAVQSVQQVPQPQQAQPA